MNDTLLTVAERVRAATIADSDQEGVNIAEGRFGSAMASLCRDLDAALLANHQCSEVVPQCSDLLRTQAAQHQGEPAAWSYKFGGEQRFYPTDPRVPEAGASASYFTDVEPLYRHPAEQPAPVTELNP